MIPIPISKGMRFLSDSFEPLGGDRRITIIDVIAYVSEVVLKDCV